MAAVIVVTAEGEPVPFPETCVAQADRDGYLAVHESVDGGKSLGDQLAGFAHGGWAYWYRSFADELPTVHDPMGLLTRDEDDA